MLRQKVACILCVAVFLLSFIPLAYAQDVVHYASIPKPTNSEMVKYIIADNSTQTNPTIYRISNNAIAGESIKYFFAVEGNAVKLYAYNFSGLSASVFIDRFNLSGQLLNTYSFNVPDGGISNAIILLNFDSAYVSYLDIGDIPLQEGSASTSYGLPSIAWADATDPQVYLTQIEEIQRRLALLNIDAGAAATYLLSIETELTLIKELFSSNSAIIKTQTDKIDDSLNELNEDLNEDMSELNQGVEELKTQGQVEYESAVGEAENGLDAFEGIENKGTGFFDAIGGLISAVSYNGTDCNWKLPDVYIPEIEGIIPKIKLFDNIEIPFEYWIEQIPDDIMKLARALSTSGLILFAFRELYSILSYVFTLKKE